jgi:agmatinase
MGRKANLAFTGIATFCRTPNLLSLDDLAADVAVIGIPFDEGVGFRPGTRFGPRSIREYSMRFPFFDLLSENRGYWDLRKKQQLLTKIRMVDCGDVDVVMQDLPYVYRQIDESVKEILGKGAFPVTLGGDHSISYPVVQAFEGKGPLSVVHLDAHLDRYQSTMGAKYGHGSPIRRIGELDFIEKIVSIGLRGVRGQRADFQEAEDKGEISIPSYLIQDLGVDEIAERIPGMGKCYVTIDIDVFDPSLAPGTGTPEAGGLNYFQVKDFLSKLAEKSTIVGFDVVEVNPYFDHSGRTSLLAAQLIVEFLGTIFG